MAILLSDVIIVKSEDMSNTDQGGGRMTATELIDGQINEVFPNIPTVDRVYGAAELYKLFLAITSNNVNLFQEAFLAIIKRPVDPKVSFILFSTKSHIDHTLDAKNYVENYVVPGATLPMNFLGNQVAGQRLIITYQRETDPLPDIGEVIALIESEGTVNEQIEYVRIVDYEIETRDFQLTNCGDFKRVVLTINLSTPLLNAFSGDNINCLSVSHNAFIRSTTIADAARYYGIAQNTQVANIGSANMVVDSITAPIVPSTQREITLVDYPANGLGMKLAELGRVYDAWGHKHILNSIELPSSVLTQKKAITDISRTYSHVYTLNPLPSVGSVRVEFLAAGKWYVLTEEVEGELSGNGSGTVNHLTGSVTYTLSTLPDVNSNIITTWNQEQEFDDLVDLSTYKEIRSDLTAVGYFKALFRGELYSETAKIIHSVGEGIIPASLAITYKKLGANVTLTSNSSGNILEGGSVVGTYLPGNGNIEFAPKYIPDVESAITYAYDTYNNTFDPAANYSRDETISPEILLGNITFYLNEAPIEGNVGFFLNITYDYNPYWTFSYALPNNLAYQVYTSEPGQMTVYISDISPAVTVNYVNGQVILSDVPSTISVVLGAFGTTITKAAQINSVRILYSVNGPILSRTSSSSSQTTMKLLGNHTTTDQLVGNSLYFFMSTSNNPSSFTHSNSTPMYRELNGVIQQINNQAAETFSNTAGTVDLDLATIALTPQINGLLNQWYILSGIIHHYKWPITTLDFRTNAVPIAPLSFQVRIGSEIATADVDGNISSSLINGTVKNSTGVVSLVFVNPVIPNKIFYNAIALSYLPLDADLLGLNPVRLPGNGRVPIFSQSDIVLIYEEKSDVMPNPLSADNTFQAAIFPLKGPLIIDQNDVEVDVAKYAIDKNTGIVTMANPLDLSAYTQPLVLKYYFDELKLVTDIDIEGKISFATGLEKVFSENATVSSILRFGDLQARISVFFSQETWTGIWSDSKIGNNTIAQYDKVNYPLSVINKNAIKERWLVNFTSTTTFNIIGESLGLIGTGNTSTDATPINPNTAEPYFTILASGWGSGWSTGDAVRCNTESSAAPFNILRTVLSGSAVSDTDSVVLYRRGDTE